LPGTLYIVATPIGNLEDITLRALRILREADLVAAEDTRHTLKLLSHFDISVPLIAFHQHSDAHKADQIIRRMTGDNQTVALVTDAGTPGVSDPGLELVQAAIAAQIPVVPLPGASATLCALVGSGLPLARFAFEGFLPRTKSDQREKLELLARETRTLVFYEAPGRTAETLAEMARAFGPARPTAVGRELTKKHEEFVRGTLAELAAHFKASEARGEVTIVVAGLPETSDEAGENIPVEEDLPTALASALARGLSERDAVREVSQSKHLSRRDVYAAMLELKASDG